MLRIEVPLSEGFDEQTNEFVTSEAAVLELEHSLLSLSKWESRWEIPFLSSDDKTTEQTMDYIKAMCLGEEPSDSVLSRLTAANIKAIDVYVNAKMTATTINERKSPGVREIVTAELIYYWMIALDIPVQCEQWHLNRLLTLIKVCNIKNTPPDKKSAAANAADRRALNAQRRSNTGSGG